MTLHCFPCFGLVIPILLSFNFFPFVFDFQLILMSLYPGPEIMFSDRHVRIPGHGKLEVEATGRIGVDRDVVANITGGCKVVCFMLVVMVLFMGGGVPWWW